MSATIIAPPTPGLKTTANPQVMMEVTASRYVPHVRARNGKLVAPRQEVLSIRASAFLGIHSMVGGSFPITPLGSPRDRLEFRRSLSADSQWTVDAKEAASFQEWLDAFPVNTLAWTTREVMEREGVFGTYLAAIAKAEGRP